MEITKVANAYSHAKTKEQRGFHGTDERGMNNGEIGYADRGRTKLSQKAKYVVSGKENMEPTMKQESCARGPSNYIQMGDQMKVKNPAPLKNKAIKSQRIHCVISGSMNKSGSFKINEEKVENNSFVAVLAENRNIPKENDVTVMMRKELKGDQEGTLELLTSLEEIPDANNDEGLENGQNTNRGRASSKKSPKTVVPPDK